MFVNSYSNDKWKNGQIFPAKFAITGNHISKGKIKNTRYTPNWLRIIKTAYTLISDGVNMWRRIIVAGIVTFASSRPPMECKHKCQNLYYEKGSRCRMSSRIQQSSTNMWKGGIYTPQPSILSSTFFSFFFFFLSICLEINLSPGIKINT